MNAVLLQVTVFVTCVLSGALAGIDIDSVLVRFPAWRRAGPAAWACYSREADLRGGMILYPVLAIGSALFGIAAAVAVYVRGPATAIPAAYCTVAFAILGLALTIRAAPIMLSLKRSGHDLASLEAAFRGFRLWSSLRATAQVIAFLASLWLFARVSSSF